MSQSQLTAIYKSQCDADEDKQRDVAYRREHINYHFIGPWINNHKTPL
ncbi:hypothetical protein [Endozoicomonas sp. GU-1]|nr:hypothetical protein [Endozoicomonas sp. GU-1]WBA81979.1 hypothetical protein O2T12_02085 [Endozoicomonas sp. GU-1]WBA84929.1 hypothetical protein O3276_16860 [Endozoicomonas sp. GU-1]